MTLLLIAALAFELIDAKELHDATPQLIASRAALLRGAPLCCDVARFCLTREDVTNMLWFNRAIRRHFEACREVWGEQYDPAIRDTEELYRSYDLLRDGLTPFYYTHVRRQALRQLRGRLSGEAWDHGVLPPHVPYWHMTEVR